MKSANEAVLKETVPRVLSGIAPEVDSASIDPAKDIRDQIDIDSVDFLNFVIGLHKELGIEIPDSDVAKLSTLEGCVTYLNAQMKQAG